MRFGFKAVERDAFPVNPNVRNKSSEKAFY